MTKIIQFPRQERPRKPDARLNTLYAIAQNCDYELLDKIMESYSNDKRVIGHNSDEFDNTIFDYAIYFAQIDLVKYMIKKDYMRFVTYDPHHYYLARAHANIKNFCSLFALAVVHDDAGLFSDMLSRIYPVFVLDDEENFPRGNVYEGYDLSQKMLDRIFQTKNIFAYLVSPYSSPEDWRMANFKAYSFEGPLASFPAREQIENLPRLPLAFITLLRYALLKSKKTVAKKLLKIAISHNQSVLELLRQHFDLKDLKISKDGVVMLKKGSEKIATNLTVLCPPIDARALQSAEILELVQKVNQTLADFGGNIE